MTYMHTNTPHIFIFTDTTYMHHTNLVHKEPTHSRRKHGYIATLPTGLTMILNHSRYTPHRAHDIGVRYTPHWVHESPKPDT